MLKAVIFDDAPIVIKGLQEMIDWSKYNIIIVGSATDGNTAMKVVNDLQPDIILTDIRKPGLDGLQLIEFVVDIFPEITCVVFSGFKEYDYVKKALKLGVVDYLEKPITIEKIEELIPQILAKIEEQKQYNSLKSQSKLSYKEQLERAAMELLFKGYNAEQKWKNIIDQLSEFEVQSVTVLTSSERLNWKEGTPSTYSVIELHLEDQFIYVFYKFSVITSYDRILEDDVDSLEAIVGVGTTMEKKEGTLKSYNDSLKALRYGQYVAEPGFHSYDELKRSLYISEDYVTVIKEIRDSISELNRDRALLYVAKYLNIIDNKLLEPDIVEREILKLIYLVIETVQAKELARSEYLFMNYIPHVEIKEIKSKSEMKIWLKTQIEGILAGLDRNNKDKHPCIQKAIQFIEKNFNQPITLNEVAEYVDMNATYFSYLFKEEMGISYIKYVTEVRINKAKTMLEKGEKVTDVSEQVGYHTYRHFSEVFKKKVGISPGQYKNG